jgi:hypothetical protein
VAYEVVAWPSMSQTLLELRAMGVHSVNLVCNVVPYIASRTEGKVSQELGNRSCKSADDGLRKTERARQGYTTFLCVKFPPSAKDPA